MDFHLCDTYVVNYTYLIYLMVFNPNTYEYAYTVVSAMFEMNYDLYFRNNTAHTHCHYTWFDWISTIAFAAFSRNVNMQEEHMVAQCVVRYAFTYYGQYQNHEVHVTWVFFALRIMLIRIAFAD